MVLLYLFTEPLSGRRTWAWNRTLTTSVGWAKATAIAPVVHPASTRVPIPASVRDAINDALLATIRDECWEWSQGNLAAELYRIHSMSPWILKLHLKYLNIQKLIRWCETAAHGLTSFKLVRPDVKDVVCTLKSLSRLKSYFMLQWQKRTRWGPGA